MSFASSFGGQATLNGNGGGGGGQSNGGLRAPGLSVGMSRGDSGSSMATEEDAHHGGGSKSRRMMDQLNFQSTPPSLSTSRLGGGGGGSSALQLPSTKRRDSASSQGSSSSSQPHSPHPENEDDAPTVPTAALTEAISAFSSAGARGRDGRRGGLADQGYTSAAVAKAKAARSTALNPNDFPDTPAFREVQSVLATVAKEWPVLMYGTSAAQGEGADGEPDEEKDFDPVSLALGLLDPSTTGTPNSLPAFLRLKSQLDNAISSTLASSTSSYRAYESSITTHNSTLQSLGQSQKQVAELKKLMGEAREKLEGKGREGLVGMWNRMSHLEEMGKILDEM